MSALLADVLSRHEQPIVDRIVDQLNVESLRHYHELAGDQLRARIQNMIRSFAEAVEANPATFVVYMVAIGRERIAEGFGLNEVQAALGYLEQHIWHLVTEDVGAEERVNCLARITWIIGAAKDQLALVYLESLANDGPVMNVNPDRLESLAKGTDPAPVTEEDRATVERTGRTGVFPSNGRRAGCPTSAIRVRVHDR
jgi:hypothetical protein